MPWLWLGLFGAIQGLNEWLELFALSLGTNSLFSSIRLAVMVVSFVFLLEFGRRSIPSLRPAKYVGLIYVPLVLFIFFYAFKFGSEGSNAAARYSLCFVGSTLSAYALVRASKRAEPQLRPWLRACGVLTGAYAVAAGVIVPAALFWPACVVNTDIFTGMFGFPVQLLRATLACATAGVLWMYCHALCPIDSVWRLGRRTTVITMGAILVVLAAGWVFTDGAGRAVDSEFSRGVRCGLLASASGLDPSTVAQLTGSPRDLGTQAHNHAVGVLTRMQSVHGDEGMYFKDACVTGLRHRQLVCLADALNGDVNKRFAPGQPYLNARLELMGVASGKRSYAQAPPVPQADKPIYVFTALRDPASGTVAGVLTVELDSHEWLFVVARQRLSCILAALLTIVLILIWSLSLQRAGSFNARLSASKGRYRSLVEGSTNIVSFFDSEGRFESVNQAGYHGLGLGIDELIGRRFSDIWPDNLRSAMQDAASLVLSGEKRSFEADFQRSDGQVRSYRVVLNPICDSNGAVTSFAGIWTDVTDDRLAQQKVADNLRFLQVLIDAIPHPVFYKNANGEFLGCNEAFASYTGVTKEQVCGSALADPALPELADVYRQADDTLLAHPGIQSFETKARRGDGTLGDIILCKATYLDPDGDVGGLVGTIMDITERKQAESALEWEAQVNSAMAEISSAVLSTPSIEVISDLVLAHAKQITGSTNGFVGYIDPRTDCFVCPTINEGEAAGMHASSAGFDADVSGHPHDWMLRHRSSLLSNDIDRNPTWPALAGGHPPVKRVLSVPAMLGDEQLGRIVLANPGRDYTERDLSCLERLSSLYAIAIRRKRTEDELRIQTSAINATSDQVIITDLEGRIKFVNPAFEKETGYKPDEVIGHNPRILKSGRHDNDFYAGMWGTIKGGCTWHGEVTNIRKDGSLVVEDVTITPVRDEQGKLEHFVAIKRNVTEKKVYEQQLDYLAYHDPLTGLPNRLLFSDRLTHRLTYAKSAGQMLGVMFIDVDRFKLINDTLGHNTGDMLLKGIAERLQMCLRDVDTIARMGGDEFTVIVSNMESEEDVVVIANRILGILREPFQFDDRELFVTVSIGISTYPADGVDVETLVKNADTAMYRSKDRGRGNYQLFTEAFNAADLERMNLEHGLRKALERDEFLLHYQPQVDMKTGQTLGCESLIRWQHPEYGLVPPGRFIPLAEETGLIVPISWWVLRTACARNKAWQDAGYPPIVVGVNISACLLHQENFVGRVSEVLAETRLDARFLELELTESALMENTETATSVLHRLKEMGVKVSVDDFGTGYSSLSYLKKFPIDSVKIDQSFIRDITTNPDDAAIAGAVIAMAHSLKLNVIAEGVETIEQLEFLQSLKCDEVQGYFISRPVSAEDFRRILEGRSGTLDTAWDTEAAA